LGSIGLGVGEVKNMKNSYSLSQETSVTSWYLKKMVAIKNGVETD
jgi:hypothetical protein